MPTLNLAARDKGGFDINGAGLQFVRAIVHERLFLAQLRQTSYCAR